MCRCFKLVGAFILLMSFMLFAYACSKEEEIPVGTIRITFVSNGESSIQLLKTDGVSDFTMPQNPTRNGFVFGGWYWDNETFNDPFTIESLLNRVLTNDLQVYAKWIEAHTPAIQIEMVQVGEADQIYMGNVVGGYHMAIYETTEELWYTVLEWAILNGYHFYDSFVIDEIPVDGENLPISSISWRDIIVWMNALSEMNGLDPVYRTSGGMILRDASEYGGCYQYEEYGECFIHSVDIAVQTSNDGYRLPTFDEWEVAARWRNSSGDGSERFRGRYWTPNSYASGATADTDDEETTRSVAWYKGAPGGNFKRPVGQLLPNHLGIYDMSGNVWEWTFTTTGSGWWDIRGGSYRSDADYTQVGSVVDGNPGSASDIRGFRLVRGQ